MPRDRAGQKVRPMNADELGTLFELAERNAPWEEAWSRLPARDRTTVIRRYGIATHLRLVEGSLTPADVKRIAKLVGYGVRRGLVEEMHLQYRLWQRGRIDPQERERQEVLAQAHRQSRLDHYMQLRHLVARTSSWLPFWPVTHLSGTDPAWGMRSDGGVRHNNLYWTMENDGRCLRLFPPEFFPIQEHVETSSEEMLRGELDRWQSLGGSCIEACWELWSKVLHSSQEETGLPLHQSEGTEQIERGLFRDFPQSLYMTVLGEQHNCDYHIDSEGAELDLLTFRDEHSVDGPSFTLAWIKKDERDQVVAIHRALLRSYSGAPLAQRIRHTESEINETVVRLTTGLVEFARTTIIPGKCHLCPE